MTGRQDQNGTDEKGLFGDFSVSTVIASGLAAATSFALSSKIGLAGSIIGVAIGGVASAAASQIYKSLLKASAQKLSDLTPDATANAAPEEAAAVDAEPAADETRVYRPGSLSGRSPIQEVAASGTPIAPASVRYAAHERERRVLRRRATAIAAAFAIAAVLLFALVVNIATQGAGIGSAATSSSGEATSPTTEAPAGQDATKQTDGKKATSSPEAPAKKDETTQPEKQQTASPAPVAQPAPQAQPKPEVKPQPKPVEQKPESEGLTVRFALAKAVVTEDEAAKIAAFAQWLKNHPKAKAEITGYADAGTGNTGINSNLSRQRVQAVAKILTQKHGIPASRIKTAYKGDTVQPFAANDDNRVVIGTAVEK